MLRSVNSNYLDKITSAFVSCSKLNAEVQHLVLGCFSNRSLNSVISLLCSSPPSHHLLFSLRQLSLSPFRCLKPFRHVNKMSPQLGLLTACRVWLSPSCPSQRPSVCLRGGSRKLFIEWQRDGMRTLRVGNTEANTQNIYLFWHNFKLFYIFKTSQQKFVFRTF